MSARVSLRSLRIAIWLAASTTCFLAHPSSAAPSLNIIYPFTSDSTGPWGPKSKLLQGPNATFYGTSTDGGQNGAGFGDGAIYSVDLHGNENTMYSFTDNADGDSPAGGLAMGPDGQTMFGTSINGVNINGTIFTIGVGDASINVIHSFDANDTDDGSQPNGDLVLGPDGNTFYGTTSGGGLHSEGIVFSITADTYTFTKLVSFHSLTGGENDGGANPTSGVTIGDDGNIYGVTQTGGANGNGAVYTAGLNSITSIHDFSAVDGNGFNTDGITPMGELAKAPDGSFYGVCNAGGQYGFGTVFRITTGGSFSVIHNFKGGADGYGPIDVAVSKNGTLCGMTENGGLDAGGSIFLIYPNHLDTNFSFNGGAGGQIPTSGLVVGSDGNFYGTNSSGGENGGGVFFEVGVNRSTIEPYGLAAGRYFGVLDGHTGTFSLTLSANGNYTGSIFEGAGRPIAFHGTLVNNIASQTVAGNSLTLQLNGGGGGAYVLDATFGGNPLEAFRSFYDALGSVPVAGQYNLQSFEVANPGGTAFFPTTSGDEVLTVSKLGIVTLSGVLPDGTPLRSAGLLLLEPGGLDVYIFFNSLNLFGNIEVGPGVNNDAGDITWNTPAGRSHYFPAGFDIQLQVQTAQYIPPARDTPAIGPALTFAAYGGAVALPINQSVNITDTNKVVPVTPNPYHLSITLNAARGTFAGSFVPPQPARQTPIHFSGLIYQNSANSAIAVFLGSATLGPSGIGQVVLQ